MEQESLVTSDECGGVSGRHPNAAVPASSSQAVLATALLHTVPYLVSSLFFLGLYGWFTAEGLLRWIQSTMGQVVTTGVFGAGLAAVLWSAYILLSFWLHRLQAMFGARGRGLLFLALLPTLLLGPFYGYSVLAVAAFKSRDRRLLLWCLPGIAAGYVALAGVLNMLSGDLAVNWTNAFLVPGVTLVLALCSVRCIMLADGCARLASRPLWAFAGLHVAWLLVSALFWCMAWQTERHFAEDMEVLSQHYGRPLTNEALLAAYYHDDQQAADSQGALARAVTAGVRRRGDGRKPVVISEELSRLLDQGGCSPAILKQLQVWEKDNEDFWHEMDASSTGRLFKVDVRLTGERYVSRQAVVSNLNVWMLSYLGRLIGVSLAGEPSGASEGLELLRRMTWLRDSALDDPFLLANGNCVGLEQLRLQGMGALIGSRLLNDRQLRDLSDGLEADSQAWERRTERAAWAALAWYLANVQDMEGESVFQGCGGQSAFNDLLFGFASPLHLWMLRQDGRWLLDYYLARRNRPAMEVPSLEEEASFARTIPATATTAVRLAVPVGQQFVPLRTRQLALLQAIGVERYRLAHGRLPQTLQELVPGILPSLPADPFSGQPFQYKVLRRSFGEDGGPVSDGKGVCSVGGFVVYSVGWDRHDDGGIALATERDASGRVSSVRQDLLSEIWFWGELSGAPR